MATKKSAVHQPSPKVLACRRNGRLGGLARARNKTKAEIKKWSAKGGNATVDRYGSGIMTFINYKKKTAGRYKKPVIQTRRRKVA